MLPAADRISQSIESSETTTETAADRFYISVQNLKLLPFLEQIFIFLFINQDHFLLFRTRFSYFGANSETAFCFSGTDFEGESAMRRLLYSPTRVTSVVAIRAMGCAESYYSWATTIAE